MNKIGRMMERMNPKRKMCSVNERVVKSVTVVVVLMRSIIVKGHLPLDCK